MRVNSKVFSERTDMFSDLYVKGAPNQLESVCNRLLNMAAQTGYSVGKYNTMSVLDKKLTVDYWNKYDGLYNYEHDDESKSNGINEFKEWYIHFATEASLIERAIRFLIERNYFIVDEDVRLRAQEAARNYRQAVRG